MITAWIVNHNTANLVSKLTATLPNSIVDRILILDNSSKPDQIRELRAIASRDARIERVFHTANRGFGAGMNEIARQDRGDADGFVWLLNPDIEVAEFQEAEIQALLAEHPNAIISPLITGAMGDRDLVWFAGGRIDTKQGLCSHIDYGQLATPNSFLNTTDFVTGAAPMMSRSTFKRLDGFDERLFLYWEDVEFSLRASYMQVPLLVTSAAKLVHLEGGASRVPKGPTYRFYMARNRILVCTLSEGRRFLISGATNGAKQILASVRGGRGMTHRLFASLRGTRHGIAHWRKYTQGTRCGLQTPSTTTREAWFAHD